MLTLLGLAAATVISEDAACLGAALLIARGTVPAFDAIAACTIGIFAGDLGLWALGRAGAAGLARWRFAARYLALARAHQASQQLLDRAAQVIVASRFFPGTRLPLYVAAGATGVPFRRFAGWSLLACCIWTPAIVLTAGHLSAVAAMLAPHATANTLAFQGGGALLTIPFIRLLRAAGSPSQRQRLAAKVARWQRWEFWPMWLFYLPVGLWLVWLTIRHRGVTMTAANPGMPDGGTVGESKSDILASLPTDVTIPSFRLAPEQIGARLARCRLEMTRKGWAFPLVLKPDVGQRGAGVRLARDWNEVRNYFSTFADGAVLVQPYDPGPFEAGVFYVRHPEWTHGRIFSITDKVFPEVTGDGAATVAELIWRHARYRMQAPMFLGRLGLRAGDVPASGERIRLAVAGNHAQGTLFRDGTHLITPALEARFDTIARQVPGFFIGRFDVRYRSVDQFRRGTGFAIVELNGATAESTNIYDPDRSLLSAYCTLFEQWSLVFSIGAANRRLGAQTTSIRRLCGLIATHLTTPTVMPVSD
jgi:membrane protein DedA with SNARE-associated domain